MPETQWQLSATILLLPNTISKKDEKPHTTGPYDTAIPHIKIKVAKILLENMFGMFLDRLEEVVVLVVLNHHS